MCDTLSSVEAGFWLGMHLTRQEAVAIGVTAYAWRFSSEQRLAGIQSHQGLVPLNLDCFLPTPSEQRAQQSINGAL
jgi:hypothetical protein